MASNLSLFVKLGVDLKGLEKGLNSASAKLQSFGKSMTKTGKDLSMKVTAPVVALGALTLKTAGDFEAAMNKVQAISGATGAEFEALRKQARDLGATTQFSATQAADAMTFLSMAGFETNEIIGAMPSTLNLAAAAQLDMGSAADIVSNIMAGFNMTTEELGGAVDVLAKQFTTSNTNLSQLGEAMKYVAPVASGLGVSIQESSAAIGALSDAGIQGSMAGTGLRRILSTLSQKSDELGISVFDSSGKMKPFADILQDLEGQGLSTSRIMEVFGERGGPALMALLSKGSKAIREQTTLLDNAGGTAQKIADTQMKGLNGALEALRSAFEELQLAIADSGLLDSVTSFAQGLTTVIRRIGEANPSIIKMAVVAAALAAAIGPLLILVGQMAIGIGAVIKAVIALTAAIAANPIGAFAIAVGVAVAALQAYRYATKEASIAATALDDVQKSINSNMAEEQLKLDMLFDKLKKTNKGSDERREIIEKINSKYGDLIGFTIDENTELGKLKTAYDNIVSSMKEKVKQQVISAKQEELMAAQLERSTSFIDDFRNAMQKGNRPLERYDDNIVDIVKNVHELFGAQQIYNQVGKDALDTFLKQVGISEDLFFAYDDLSKMTMRVNGSTVHLDKAFFELSQAKSEDNQATRELNKLLGDTIKKTNDAADANNNNADSTDNLGDSLLDLANKLLDAEQAAIGFWDEVWNKQEAKELSDWMKNNAPSPENMNLPTDMVKQFTDAINKLGARFNLTMEEMISFTEQQAKLAIALDNMAQVVTGPLMQGFEGFFNTLLQGGQNAFGAIIDAIKQLIIRLASAAATAAVLAGIIAAVTGGTGKVFALFGGGSDAGLFGTMFNGIMGFADGGVPPVGKPSIVGERGPELFVPRSSGTVIPNHMLGGGSGEVTFRIQGRELVGILGREGKLMSRT